MIQGANKHAEIAAQTRHSPATDSADELLGSANSASGAAQNAWLAYLVLTVYLLVTIAGVTHFHRIAVFLDLVLLFSVRPYITISYLRPLGSRLRIGSKDWPRELSYWSPAVDDTTPEIRLLREAIHPQNVQSIMQNLLVAKRFVCGVVI